MSTPAKGSATTNAVSAAAADALENVESLFANSSTFANIDFDQLRLATVGNPVFQPTQNPLHEKIRKFCFGCDNSWFKPKRDPDADLTPTERVERAAAEAARAEAGDALDMAMNEMFDAQYQSSHPPKNAPAGWSAVAQRRIEEATEAQRRARRAAEEAQSNLAIVRERIENRRRWEALGRATYANTERK
jgi:hypothetical protein